MSYEGTISTGEIERQTTAFTQQADSPSTESSIPIVRNRTGLSGAVRRNGH